MTVKQNNRAVGTKKEALAAWYLNELGFRILQMNFRTRQGEIDIIARDGNTISFVEVKYRKDDNAGYPSEAVDHRKQQRILMASEVYLLQNGLTEADRRYDVVEIIGRKIRIIKNAFGGNI